MKKIVIALVCVTSFSVFADRYGRHDRRDHRRPVMVRCEAGMFERGRLIRTFTEFGRFACEDALRRCDREAARTRFDLRIGHARCRLI